MRTLLAVCLIGIVGWADEPSNPVKALLDKTTNPTIPKLVKALEPGLNGGFTLAFKSVSEQGPDRGILFGDEAEHIVTVEANDGVVEMVSDRDGFLTPQTFEMAPGSKSGFLHNSEPKRCARCHGNPFTYIWKPYKGDRTGDTWPEFIGSIDDRVNPDDANFKELKEGENISPLFAAKTHRASYPYWQIHVTKDKKPVSETKLPKPIDPDGKNEGFEVDGSERLFTNSPNARLTALLGMRAGRSVALRVAKLHPERYEKYKYALLSKHSRLQAADRCWHGVAHSAQRRFQTRQPGRGRRMGRDREIGRREIRTLPPHPFELSRRGTRVDPTPRAARRFKTCHVEYGAIQKICIVWHAP
jgi:hypothetical protein